MTAAHGIAQQPEAPATTKSDAANPPGRLFEQVPFDTIHFKDDKQINIVPLQLKGRKLPENPRPTDKLLVRTIDDPDSEYEVVWRDIAKIELFEHLVLAEADALVSAGKFNEAFDYFDFLQVFYPKMTSLPESIENYLYEDAKSSQRKGQFEQSLGLLNEIYARNPQFAGLDKAIGAATGKLVELKVAQKDRTSARRLVQSLIQKFPASQTSKDLEQQLATEARQGLSEAQAQLAAGRYREAADTAHQALHIWPLEEAKQLWAEAHRKFPRVVVGVTLPGGRTEANTMTDWAARRSARLFNRSLLEFQGYGPQGGMFQCPVGEFERQDLGLRMAFRLRKDIPWSQGDGVLTGNDVACRLLALADPTHPAYRADWADLFAGVSVRDVFNIDVELRRAHVHPDAMLQTILRPWNALPGDDRLAPSIGPYVIDSSAGAETRYLANARYFASSATQPKEIVERFYPEARLASAALKVGDIAILDRVLPWEVESLKTYKHLAVEPYAVPTIHCLLPNQSKPFLARRNFRRALVYGIQREAILREQLLKGSSDANGQVISGPFPKGANNDDPVGYAYNANVPVRPYEPRVAMTLAGLARHEILAMTKTSAPDEEKKSGADPLPPIPTLVLVHPPHDVARVACRTIQRQLKVIGFPVVLKETKADNPTVPEGDWDLLYTELAMWEPIVDAKRLLGTKGLVQQASPYMDLALRQLDRIDDWKRAREKLLEIHRLADDDVPVIPLWQITDHFAYQRGLIGVGSRPAMLYQNIEAWQSPPWFAEDSL